MTLEDAVLFMKKTELERILDNHPFAIREEYDGRWATYLRDPEKKNGRKRIVKASEEQLISFLYSYYKKQDEKTRIAKLTLLDIYPEWMEYKSLRVGAQNTCDRISLDWKKYYLNTEIVKIPLLMLDKMTLDDWAHKLVRNFSLSKKQYNNMAIIMRQILDYAVEKNYIKENNMWKVHIDKNLFRPIRKKDSSYEVFMEDEEDRFKEYAWECFYNKSHKKQPLTPLAVLFLLQTGLRIGELRALMYSDITEDGKHISVDKMVRVETGEVVESTKGVFGGRIVALSDEAIKIIETARRFQKEKGVSSRYIFSMNEKPIGYHAVNKAYYSYCDAIGTQRKSTHKARKTVVSALFDGGMNPDEIRKMVGHVDIRTTYNSYCYNRRSDETNREILNKSL
ncbi:MAG: tyrosine-type recombinase/integrase [Firmicutes bacterium]|nr:tyrosine-type recombinase/integrase [Bacillota bacterium]